MMERLRLEEQHRPHDHANIAANWQYCNYWISHFLIKAGGIRLANPAHCLALPASCFGLYGAVGIDLRHHRGVCFIPGVQLFLYPALLHAERASDAGFDHIDRFSDRGGGGQPVDWAGEEGGTPGGKKRAGIRATI